MSALDNIRNDRPLPEVVADMHGFKLARADDLGVRYYAVQDWIAGVTGLTDAKVIADKWRGLKRDRRKKSDSANRPSLSLAEAVISLPYRASDGKRYQRDFADAQTLFVITQRLNADTPLADNLRAFLAKAGVLADSIRRDPSAAIEAGIGAHKAAGKPDYWIAMRAQGIDLRRLLTDAMDAHVDGIRKGDYGGVTNSIYRKLWGRDAEELRADMGISARASLRDNQPVEALLYQGLVESVIARRLDALGTLTRQTLYEIVREVGELYRQQAEQTSALLGIDLATGKPLLKP